MRFWKFLTPKLVLNHRTETLYVYWSHSKATRIFLIFYSSKINYQETNKNLNNEKIIMCLKKNKPGVCHISIHIISDISKLSVEIITIYKKWEKGKIHFSLDISCVELYSTRNIFFQTGFLSIPVKNAPLFIAFCRVGFYWFGMAIKVNLSFKYELAIYQILISN